MSNGRVNPVTLMACRHGWRPAHNCPGDDCKPMTHKEVVEYCTEMTADKDDAIATAFELGKRIGWTRKEI